MIQLYNDYVLLSDSYQWTLAKKHGVLKKTGKDRYIPIAYFTRLDNALEDFRRRNIRSALENSMVTLNQALIIIKNENERLEKFIQDNIPDA